MHVLSFYRDGLAFTPPRRLSADVAEMTGGAARLYLLRKDAGTQGPGGDLRCYERHWTPVHLDIVVEDIEAALCRAASAGAKVETPIRVEPWGKFAVCADLFGHGFCLIEFIGRGYDEGLGTQGRGAAFMVSFSGRTHRTACGRRAPRRQSGDTSTASVT